MARVWAEAVGCKVSRADVESLLAGAVGAGHEAAVGPEAADIAVLTTCCVTAEAERSSRQRARRLAARGLAVVVTGCAVAYRREQFDHPSMTVVPIDRVEEAVARLARPEELGRLAAAAGPVGDRAQRTQAGDDGVRGRTRAVLKVQDGCDGSCAYCAVRLVRGGLWSLPPQEASAAARSALASGCGELVLSGINLGLYGRGLPGGTRGAGSGRADLAALISSLVELPGLERLRLSSLEPLHVTTALLEVLDHPRVARHLHLPLQSADDGVLREMSRPYTYAEYLDRLEAARSAIPGLAVTTDVIVGFPTETEAAFERTLAAIGAEGPFGRVHVFTFSPREGTAGAALPPLSAEELRRRRRAAARAADDARAAAAGRLVGSRVEVLVEGTRDGVWSGYSSGYVRCRGNGEVPRGRLLEAVVRRASPDGVWCELSPGMAEAERRGMMMTARDGQETGAERK